MAPSIFIILNLNKNNLFIFHWLLIALGIFFLTVGDLGYTYSAQISEELIVQTHSVWNIFYAIAYILLITGIFWYGRIKQILYDNEVDSILKNAQVVYKGLEVEIDHSNNVSDEIEFNENIKGSKDIIKTFIELVKKTERYIDILFTNESYLNINKINEVLDSVREVINKKIT